MVYFLQYHEKCRKNQDQRGQASGTLGLGHDVLVPYASRTPFLGSGVFFHVRVKNTPLGVIFKQKSYYVYMYPVGIFVFYFLKREIVSPRVKRDTLLCCKYLQHIDRTI